MSSFIDDVKNMLNSTKTLTENGAVAYETSGSKLLDINFAVSGLRSASEKDIEDYFVKAYFENPTLAVVWLFLMLRQFLLLCFPVHQVQSLLLSINREPINLLQLLSLP